MSLEVWGGIECTLNRVNDQYFDQCTKNGHSLRLIDFQLFKDIGIKKLRYPCLWENVSMESPRKRNWEQLDEKLAEIRRLGMTPIAGFLHHGSGPKYTHLLDPNFPTLFAEYAKDFATRYPWIENFTPVNEILTTARFSCLYGHWFPHEKNDYAFLKAVFLQCKATVLAMREIRKITPDAKLIQTEDMGKCQSTEKLAYQRDFENERRWLAYDILYGKFNQNHKLFKYVVSSGISYEEIQWTTENYFRPDILGINHYLLSNRYLDDRIDLYPENFHGGNGFHQYADVGVIDTGQAELPLPEDILVETWQRYKIPLAVTEVHTRGHREEQMRWFYQMWNSCETAKNSGVEIQGITAWSLLGTYDWHSLCTKDDYFYEPGVFDLRSSHSLSRKTGLAKLVQELALSGETNSPILETKGSWQLERRILYAPHKGSHSLINSTGRPLLIAGENEWLNKSIAMACRFRNLPYILTDKSKLEGDIENNRPWAVLNTMRVVDSQSLYITAEYKDITETILFHSPVDETSEHFMDFIHNVLDLLIDGEVGIYHFNDFGEILCENNLELDDDEMDKLINNRNNFLMDNYKYSGFEQLTV